MPHVGAIIDCANPVNRSLATALGIAAMYRCIPGLDGGALFRDLLTAPSPSGPHGILTSLGPRPTPTLGWSEGTDRPGGSGHLNFDGSAGYVNLGTPTALNIAGEMTIALWIRPASVGGVTYGAGLVAQLNSSATISQWAVEINRTAARLNWLINGATPGPASSTDLVANRWYHATFVRRGVAGAWTLEIYLNGVLDGSATSAATSNAQQICSIGRQGAWVHAPYNGAIDEVIIATKAWSSSQAATMYAQSALGHQELLNRVRRGRQATVAAAAGGPFPWHMDELSGGLQTQGMGI